MSDGSDDSALGALHIKATQGTDECGLRREARELAFLTSNMADKSDIAARINRRSARAGVPGIVKQAASRRSIARTDDAGNLPPRVRFENANSNSGICLAR